MTLTIYVRYADVPYMKGRGDMVWSLMCVVFLRFKSSTTYGSSPTANIPMQPESFGFLYPILIMPRREYHVMESGRARVGLELAFSMISSFFGGWWHEHNDYMHLYIVDGENSGQPS